MNRLGFSMDQIEELGKHIASGTSFKVRSVFSHLASGEDPQEDGFTLQQFNLLERAIKKLKDELGYNFLTHIANSAAAARLPELQMDMVRLGIGLYGVNNTPGVHLKLHTVATLKSTVAQVKHLKKGETVSYNRKGVIKKDSVIATVRIGYADGYPRKLGNGVGKMNIHGKLAPIIGTVCMDMTMIDVTGIPNVKEGDEVIIFGDHLPVQQVAEWAQTIPYEIMTGVSQRVKRVYFEE
jgi:alanine racemase